MPTISPTLPNDGETIDAQDVNGPFNAILGVLNGNIDDQNIKPGSLPWSVMDSFSNQIPASAMQDSGNLEKFRADGKISFIPDGLIWSATTGLNAGMTSGSYYSNSGILLPITAITSRTFTASRDTYVSIAQNGSIAYSEVTNNAAMPSLPSNSNWLAKVVTNGSTVTGVTDMRQTAPIASHNVDWTTQGGIWWQELARGNIAGDTLTLAIPAKKYLQVIIRAIRSSGSPQAALRFNGDTNNNYNRGYSENGGVWTPETANNRLSSAPVDNPAYFIHEIINDTSEKLIITNVVRRNTAGASSAPQYRYQSGKWASASLVTSVTLFNDGVGSSLSSNTEMVILGHD